MHISHTAEIEYRGQPAWLRVLRNDGFAWGRLIVGSDQLDITVDEDLYALDDSDAMGVLLDAIDDGSASIEPAIRLI